MIVKKRDGRLVEFEPDKILNSIKKAALAVEGKDDDLQERARQILNIKNQLIASGFDPEDAEEQAEEQFDGYIENGEYTEYNEEEAQEVLNIVVESFDNLGIDIVDSDEIQDFVEKALVMTGHTSTAREYIAHRLNRERIREMNTSLMKSYENLTFGNSRDVESKRENANIDGDSAMGTMLKYGSEGAKKFNLLYLVPPDISKAHSDGDIHIHDLDFYSLTETCIAPTTKLIVKYNGSKDYAELNASFLEEYLSEVPLDTWVNISQLKIYSRGTFTNVLRAIKHSAANKRVISIETDFGSLEVTDEHRIPVIRYNREIEIQAGEIVVGDKLLIDLPPEELGRRFKPVPQKVTNITELRYKGNVYDLETENHYYSASGFTVHNCVQIDLDKLFKNGFNTGHGFLREPGEIRSYAALACIAIQCDQNDQHGGQSIPNFDYYMAAGVAKTFIKSIYSILDIKYNSFSIKDEVTPSGKLTNKGVKSDLKKYIAKHRLIMNDAGYAYIHDLLSNKYANKLDESEINYIIDKAKKITDDQTHQAMEALVHNLNSMHSRAGAQVPFSSINFGTDTSEEGRMASFNLLRATDEGLGNGETPIFPISIFKEKAGISYNPGDPNYDLWKEACRVSAKRLFPNFSNLDAPYNLQYYKDGDIDTEIAYMGCRTRVIANTYDPTYEKVTGRGNLSFTSINLPRLGIRANGNITEFFNMLDNMLELVHRQLLERFEVQCRKHPRNYPFLMGQGIWRDSDKLGPDDDIREILKNGTLTVGFIGLAECLKALIGKHHGESEQAQELGLSIIKRMREATDRWSREEKMNYSVIATPAEGLSGRFINIDKKKFGVIEGVTDRKYYTNSFHVPVYYNISAFKKINIEAPYHTLCNGGHISYIEMDGDPLKNIEAFEKVVRYMHDKGIGYGAINHPADYDPVCGYTGIIDDVCPRCGRRDGEPMTEEMWQKIKGYPSYANASQCGYCGDPFEESDRTPLSVE